MGRKSFQAAYQKAKRDALSHATAQLQANCGKAVKALLAVADDPEAPASARGSAARSILELADRFVQTEEITARVEALEKAQAGKTIQ